MRRIALVIFLFLMGLTKSQAQTIISGTVTDTLNNPVPFASVYLQNTTVGDDTDSKGNYWLTIPKDGTYNLTVSCIGYKSSSQIVQVKNRNLIINFRIYSDPLSLNEVVVSARNKNRIRNYAQFKKLFIGESGNAKNCKVNNLKDLRLYGDGKGNITKGYSIRPLEIENKALGYFVKYYLEDFTYNDSSKIVKFSGSHYFKPLRGSESKNIVWEENRTKTYFGSEMHFLRTLYSHNTVQSGFKIFNYKLDSLTKLYIPIDTLFEEDLETENTMLYKCFYFKKPILVNYQNPVQAGINSESIIYFADTAQIFPNGNLANPYALTFSGKLGVERIADKLPFDFSSEGEDTSKRPTVDFYSEIDKVIMPAYDNYFANSYEQVYTHFNKSTYMPREDVWFTSYITDQTTGTPGIQTKILYTELFSPEGKLIEQKMLKVEEGIAYNSFKLPNKPGNYTFRAYTNWMKNFQSPEAFNVDLEVIGFQARDTSHRKQQIDIQFLPESGTLLAGVFNRVGVKAVDSGGKGINLTGEIVDSKNQHKAKFELNRFGMGDFMLLTKSGEEYRAKVLLPDGNEQYFYLPKVEDQGVIIAVNDKFSDKIAVKITSNDQTVGNGMKFHVLFHNLGNTYKTATINLVPERTAVSFFVKDSEIANGSNCITIFNSNYEPIAEKIFFKITDSNQGKIAINHEIKNDSLFFNVTSTDSMGNSVPARLSMSVLPEGTISDNFSTNFYSEAMLKPGLNGYIEEPAYYFEKDDAEHRKALDLLFLTQGWRKYDWKSISSNKRHPYPFETSFAITGKVEDKSGKLLPDLLVTIVSPLNNLLLINSTDSKGEFLFPNLELKDKSVVIVSTTSGDGKNKNLSLTAALIPGHKADSIIKVKDNNPIAPNQNTDAEYENLLSGEILLEEVVVKEKMRKSPFDGATYKPGPMEKVYEVTKENYFKYPTLQRLLSAEFNVSIRRDTGYYYFRLNRARSSDSVFVVIDDINFRNDYGNIDRINIDAIEAISVVENGFPVFEDVAAIIIKTRKVPLDFGTTKAANINYLNIKGYSSPAKYYTPQYVFTPDTKAYQKYATIFWKPDIVTNQEGKTSFKFLVSSGVKGLKVRTEGFSESGIIFMDNSLIGF